MMYKYFWTDSVNEILLLPILRCSSCKSCFMLLVSLFLLQGASLETDNCSSSRKDMNEIIGGSPFVRELNLSPEERQKAAIADLNKALERLVEL